MLKTPIARGVALATLGTALAIPSVSHAAFVEDSKATVELRNFYFNRDDRRDTATQAKSEQWAQGFLLRFESGFTEGPVGVGVDALGLLGVKLDTGGERAAGGAQLLPVDSNGDAVDDYSKLGLAAKVKVSESQLRMGTMQVKNQALATNDSRLLPQTVEGAQLISKDIEGVLLDAGYFNRNSYRNSSNDQELRATAYGASSTGAEADDFWFLGGTFKPLTQLTAGYYYSELDQIYKQHSVNLVHILPISEGQAFKTDLRYQHSRDNGVGNVDNNAFGAMFTYSLSGHSFGLGYQRMTGDTGFAYVDGSDAFLVGLYQIRDFANPDERAWQARYDYNFAAVGVPGLTLMTRYQSGDNFERSPGVEGEEWERNTDIAYVVQNGPMKNLGVKLRNATVRSNGNGLDLDENRFIVSYTLPLM